MRAYGQTDVGRVRNHNQDFVYSSCEPVGILNNLFMVADGMGGHKAGDYASRFVIERLAAFFWQSSHHQMISALQQGIQEVNRKLYRCSCDMEELSGMGSTLVLATIEDNILYVANVGDSRLYLIRDKKARQITRDHSYVEELVALGKIERNSRDYQEQKYIITRAVGASEQVEADFFEVELKKNDVILLCSDGLSNMLTEDEIQKLASADLSLEARVKMLIQKANDLGGKDNIAVVLIEPQTREVM